MPEELNRRCPADRTRVNIDKALEVAFWTKHFGVSYPRLRAAVGAVGVTVMAVGRYLKKYQSANVRNDRVAG